MKRSRNEQDRSEGLDSLDGLDSPENPIVSRKDFFKRCAHGIMGFVGEFFSEKLDSLEKMFPMRLRPPGARSNDEFERYCTRCGNCIKACPHFVLKSVTDPSAFDVGTPYIKPVDAFCRMCEGFPCAKACSSGALILPHSSASLRPQHQGENGVSPASSDSELPKIGLAVVAGKACVRGRGVPCKACFIQCSERFHAISFPTESGTPVVGMTRCTGCGACEAACPVRPTPAIRVEPL